LPAVTARLGTYFSVEHCWCESQIGSGALPIEMIPSAGLHIRPKPGGPKIEKLAAALRALDRPIVGRIEDDGVVLDLRCLSDETGFLSALSGVDLAGLHSE